MAEAKGKWRRRAFSWGAPALAALVAIPLYAPATLAFPYKQRIGTTTVYSVAPIDRRLEAEMARADALIAASPIAAPVKRELFLTDGGWRWTWLSIGSGGSFAFGRPLTSAIVFNRIDVATDRIYNGATTAGERTLSGTIAHETTHILIARHFGALAAVMFPRWKQEGYADYVANESSLSDADAAKLTARGERVPALTYYEARRRVAATLKTNGGSVDALFRDAD
jgi:hypothetical protein